MSGFNIDDSGTFQAAFPNSLAYSGDLKLSRQILVQPDGIDPPQRIDLTPSYGHYIIYPDCSGGELLFNANQFSLQLEFVFSKADFSEMYLLNDALTSTQAYPILPFAGIAVRQ